MRLFRHCRWPLSEYSHFLRSPFRLTSLISTYPLPPLPSNLAFIFFKMASLMHACTRISWKRNRHASNFFENIFSWGWSEVPCWPRKVCRLLFCVKASGYCCVQMRRKQCIVLSSVHVPNVHSAINVEEVPVGVVPFMARWLHPRQKGEFCRGLGESGAYIASNVIRFDSVFVCGPLSTEFFGRSLRAVQRWRMTLCASTTWFTSLWARPAAYWTSRTRVLPTWRSAVPSSWMR